MTDDTRTPREPRVSDERLADWLRHAEPPVNPPPGPPAPPRGLYLNPRETAAVCRDLLDARAEIDGLTARHEQALALIRDYRSMPIGPMTVDDAASAFPMWAPLTIRADALLNAARQRLDPFIRLAPPTESAELTRLRAVSAAERDVIEKARALTREPLQWSQGITHLPASAIGPLIDALAALDAAGPTPEPPR